MIFVLTLFVLGVMGVRVVWWIVSNWDAELEAAKKRIEERYP